MSNAQMAIRAAKELNADSLAPELYRNAIDNYAKARKEYRLKNFERAKKFALKSMNQAEQAEFEAYRLGGATPEVASKLPPVEGAHPDAEASFRDGTKAPPFEPSLPPEKPIEQVSEPAELPPEQPASAPVPVPVPPADDAAAAEPGAAEPAAPQGAPGPQSILLAQLDAPVSAGGGPVQTAGLPGALPTGNIPAQGPVPSPRPLTKAQQDFAREEYYPSAPMNGKVPPIGRTRVPSIEKNPIPTIDGEEITLAVEPAPELSPTPLPEAGEELQKKEGTEQ